MLNQMHNTENLKKYPISILVPKGSGTASIVQPLSNAKSGCFIVEIWKDIIGYQELYQISNLGRVKSLPRYKKNGKFSHWTKEKILAQGINDSGYYQVMLHKNGSHKTKTIHRLVAQAFIPNPDNKPWINHKNSVRIDNDVDNLEWCTPSENNKHCYDKGRQKIYFGEQHPGSKLTHRQVNEIRDKYSYYKYTMLMLSKEYNISMGSIQAILENKTWKNLK